MAETQCAQVFSSTSHSPTCSTPDGDGGVRVEPEDREVRPAYRAAAPYLGLEIGTPRVRGEVIRSAGGGATPSQRWWVGVEDQDAGGDRLPAGVAQDRAVAGLHRQGVEQGEPRVPGVERAHVHRHRGRAQVQHQLGGQVGRRGVEPDVEQRRGTPLPRREQRLRRG